jgi:hypothetical protein
MDYDAGDIFWCLTYLGHCSVPVNRKLIKRAPNKSNEIKRLLHLEDTWTSLKVTEKLYTFMTDWERPEYFLRRAPNGKHIGLKIIVGAIVIPTLAVPWTFGWFSPGDGLVRIRVLILNNRMRCRWWWLDVIYASFVNFRQYFNWIRRFTCLRSKKKTNVKFYLFILT